MESSEPTEDSPLLGSTSDGGVKKSSCYVPARYVLAVLAFFGFVNVYAMRVNLSVALVAMVNGTAYSDNATASQQCPDDVNVNTTSPGEDETGGEFQWDEETQGWILGAFYYGYIVTQLPGGWLAGRVGGRLLLGLGVLITSVLTALTPLVARWGVVPLVVLRILEGLGEGVTFPAAHAMWGQWAPASERGRLVAISYSGSLFGTILALPSAGLLCASDFLGGWPSVFYISGATGVLWFVIWTALTHNFPTSHPRISESEKKYIISALGEKRPLRTPWREIFCSPAVWGVLAAHATSSWAFYMLLNCLPTYLARVLRLQMRKSGLLSALPYLVAWPVQVLTGLLADWIWSRRLLSTAKIRKLFNTAGLLVPAVLLVLTGYAGCDKELAVAFLTLGVGTMGFTVAGYGLNHLDIAPKFAGVLMGITNTAATIPGFVTPLVVGVLTNDDETIGQWRIVFFISAGVSLAGALLFLLLGRGEEQPWAAGEPLETDVPPPVDSSIQPSDWPSSTTASTNQHGHSSIQPSDWPNSTTASTNQRGHSSIQPSGWPNSTTASTNQRGHSSIQPSGWPNSTTASTNQHGHSSIQPSDWPNSTSASTKQH